MQDIPITESRRRARHKTYDPEPLKDRLTELLEQNKESYREAALKSGLDHQAVRRILAGNRPQMHVCVLLADHFGRNPNELLELAGWPRLNVFEIQTASAENLPPEAVDVAKEIARIPDHSTRKTVADAILTLVRKHFED